MLLKFPKVCKWVLSLKYFVIPLFYFFVLTCNANRWHWVVIWVATTIFSPKHDPSSRYLNKPMGLACRHEGGVQRLTMWCVGKLFVPSSTNATSSVWSQTLLTWYSTFPLMETWSFLKYFIILLFHFCVCLWISINDIVVSQFWGTNNVFQPKTWSL